MFRSAVFPKKQTKERSRIILIIKTFFRIVNNNRRQFFLCTLLAILTSIINFNVSVNFKEALSYRKEIVSIFKFENFIFSFRIFGYQWVKENLNIYQMGAYMTFLIVFLKGMFSIFHYYLMSYAYDSLERDLKQNLFDQFVDAKYTNSSSVSRNLITNFSSDIDSIVYNIWLMPNRLIYVLFTLFLHLTYDFGSDGGKGANWEFLAIVWLIFSFLAIVDYFLFKRASRLSIEAKRRYEEDNKMIYESINNIEYIKSSSGEEFEKQKIKKQLDETFSNNKIALLNITAFKALPNYFFIPNIGLMFLFLAFNFSSQRDTEVFSVANLIAYYLTVGKLVNEVNKIIDAMLSLDELSTNLTMVSENVEILNQASERADFQLLNPIRPIREFENGDIVFDNVVFAYPTRNSDDILKNFSFRFEKGKIYGIAGKNGIGKSTITKTTLKLYDLKEGTISINGRDIREIDDKSLRRRICHQTNRPGFFRASVAENVFYPYHYDESQDYQKLIAAAEKTGILDFISRLPQGFNTVIREGGSDLSEGQKQQISAMKIFIRDYDIYILDEILSNVHPVLRLEIIENIFSRIKGKTTIVIDHHYEIFNYVDEIHRFTGRKLIKEEKKDE